MSQESKFEINSKLIFVFYNMRFVKKTNYMYLMVNLLLSLK